MDRESSLSVKEIILVMLGLAIFFYLNLNPLLLHTLFDEDLSFFGTFTTYRRQIRDVSPFVAGPIFEFERDGTLLQGHWNDMPLVPVLSYYVVKFLSFFFEFSFKHSSFVYGTLHFLSCLSYAGILAYVMLIAYRLFGKGTAITSLFVFGISYELMMSSGYFKPSVFVAFPFIATYYHALSAAMSPDRGRHFFLTGAFLGVAAATKLNGLAALGGLAFCLVYPWFAKKFSIKTLLSRAGLALSGFILVLMVFTPHQFFRDPGWYLRWHDVYLERYNVESSFSIFDAFTWHNIFSHFYDFEYFGGAWITFLGLGGLAYVLYRGVRQVITKSSMNVRDWYAPYLAGIYLSAVFILASSGTFKGLVIRPGIGSYSNFASEYQPHLGGAFHFQYFYLFIESIFVIFASYALWCVISNQALKKYSRYVVSLVVVLYLFSFYNVAWAKNSIVKADLVRQVSTAMRYEEDVFHDDHPAFHFQYFTHPEVYFDDYRLPYMSYPPLNSVELELKKAEWMKKYYVKVEQLKTELLEKPHLNVVVYFDYTDDFDFMAVYDLHQTWTYTGKSMIHAHANGTTAYHYKRKKIPVPVVLDVKAPKLLPVSVIANGSYQGENAPPGRFTPEHAIDGKRDTLWRSPMPAGEMGWLVTNFEKPANVTKVAISIKDENSAPNFFHVYGSNDEKDWVKLGEIRGGGWPSGYTKLYDLSQNTGYFKFYKFDFIYGGSTNLFVSIADIELYGTQED